MHTTFEKDLQGLWQASIGVHVTYVEDDPLWKEKFIQRIKDVVPVGWIETCTILSMSMVMNSDN
jgi:hypothetical protein